MQSLRQAVYRYICFHSKERRRGIGEENIVREMRSRGYLEPVQERVRTAITGYAQDEFIQLQQGKYVKRDPSWRNSERSPSKLIGSLCVST